MKLVYDGMRMRLICNGNEVDVLMGMRLVM